MTTNSQRAQTLRGLACLLLVAFHVIGATSGSGMRVADDSVYRHFTELFAHLRMPLFAFLSGFVYAYRPVMPGAGWGFAQKKLLRLALPFITVSTVYFLVSQLTAEAHWQLPLSQWWTIYFFPYVHYWFLQAMILIFAGAVLLEKAQALRTPSRFAVVLACAVAASYLSRLLSPETIFSISQAMYLLPFFLLGLGANRFGPILLSSSVPWACLALFAVAMTIHAMAVFTPGVQIEGRGTVLSIAIGASGALALLKWFPQMRLLEFLGLYSFAIYLYHPFFAGASRAVIHSLQISSPPIEFIVGLMAGLLGPLVLERLVAPVSLTRPFLFGRPRTV